MEVEENIMEVIEKRQLNCFGYLCRINYTQQWYKKLEERSRGGR